MIRPLLQTPRNVQEKRVRISRIELCDFQAFPGPEVTCIDLLNNGRGKGLNLLLYGENGSGKSSLGRALKIMLSPESERETSFDRSRHIYSEPACEERAVKLVFDDGAQAAMEWKPDDDAHSEHPLFHAMARSRGWMDYRTLWNALDFKPTRDHADIFDSLAETLLTDAELPAVTSRQSFGELWKRIKETVAERPTTNYYTKYYLERLQDDIGLFDRKLRDFLPALEERTNEFLERFVPWTSVTLKLERAPVYDSSKRIRTEKFTHGTVSLRATFRGRPLKRLDGFLNEARITAIALSLFLAALTLSTPPKLADGTYFPRLLVLDDILISLDMAHRRPLLEILNEKFSDWQVILLTHDRAWYEMAKTQLRAGKWKCLEMFAVPFGDYERPLIKEDVNHLERARNFLADGEIKAAAVHVRTQFEMVLKEACRELHLKVVYVDDPKRWDANHFWDTFQARLKPDPTSPQPSDADNLKLIADVSHSLSWVLNPHSHSRPVDHIRREIQKAVESVAELERTVKRLILAQKNSALQNATRAQVAANAALAALPP